MSAAVEDRAPAPTSRRAGRPVLWTCVGIAVVAVALVGLLTSAGQPDPRNPLPGQPAPNAQREFSTLDGTSLRLDSLRGRYVVLNFFASWCVPCQVEHPELTTFSERHAATGDATVVQVVFSDTEKAVRRFRAEEGGTWPILLDPDGRFALDYGVRGPPETFLIDPRGNVLVNIKGAIDDQGLESCVRAAKAGAARCGG